MKALLRSQRGAINVLLIPFILICVFFVAAAAFGFWAFGSRQDYKDNTDQKIAAAVNVAQQQTQKQDAAQYAQAEKNPLRTYIGPSAFGNISVKYPKTWSAYVVEGKNSSYPVNGYFQPSVVPDVNNQDNSFALRVQLNQTSYDNVLTQFNAQVQQGKLTVAPYSLPKVPSVVGARLTGQISQSKQGVMIVLPLRNMTLEIWCEVAANLDDFNNIILPNLTFTP